MNTTLGEIAALIGGRVVGDAALPIVGISSLAEAGPGDISFLANKAYAAMMSSTKASAVLVGEEQPIPVPQVVVANPDLAFARVVARFGPQPRPLPPGIHPSAIIGVGVDIAADACIGPLVVIGDGARIGARTVIHAQVTIGHDVHIGGDCLLYPQVVVRERCRVDQRVILHSGTVIGADGFGYASLEGVHHKIPQVGIVHLCDDVEVGANSCIDRARFGVTRIGKGTKIDNLVQIAHNVEIGEHSIIVAQVGIAGSTRLGHHVTIAGQSGITGHVSVGDRAIVAGQSGVTKNVPKGVMVMGSPAIEMAQHREQQIALRRLGRTNQHIKELEQRLAKLESALRQQEAHGSDQP